MSSRILVSFCVVTLPSHSGRLLRYLHCPHSCKIAAEAPGITADMKTASRRRDLDIFPLRVKEALPDIPQEVFSQSLLSRLRSHTQVSDNHR